MGQPATSNLSDAFGPNNDALIPQLSERIQRATTIYNGFCEIASAFSKIGVVVERITMIRDEQQFDFPINENASGVRHNIEATTNQVTLTFDCTSVMTLAMNSVL